MKGKLKTKRFGALVDSLSSSSANHLGPYGGGKFREHSHMTFTEVGERNPKLAKGESSVKDIDNPEVGTFVDDICKWFFSSSRGISVALTEVKAFADLGEGLNEEKVVVGKVTCSVHSEEAVPL